MSGPPQAPDVVPLPQPGGCLCGAIRFRLTAAPLLAYACHCHDCQTRSGAAFSLTLVVGSAALEIEGQPEVRRRVSSSGREVDGYWCAQCRVQLLGRAPVAPDYSSVRAGTLDDASWVVPISQAFVESAIPWAVIPGVRQLAWRDFDFAAEGELWRRTAPRFVTG